MWGVLTSSCQLTDGSGAGQAPEARKKSSPCIYQYMLAIVINGFFVSISRVVLLS